MTNNNLQNTDDDKPIQAGGLVPFLKSSWHFIFLFIILLLFTLNTVHFITLDRSPLLSESQGHLFQALYSYKTLPEKAKIQDWEYFNFFYPPMVYMVTGFFYRVFGISIQTALWSIYPFSVILILSCFGLGYHFGGRAGAVGAALLAAGNNFLINFSHVYVLDVPQAALTALAFYCLVKSERFKHAVWSYLFGALFGMALLCKFGTIFFLAGPIALLVLVMAFRKTWSFLLSLVLGGGIAGMSACFVIAGKAMMGRVDQPLSATRPLFVVFFVTAGVLILITITVQVWLLKRLDEKTRENVMGILRGARALLLAMLISMPYYLYALPRLIHRFSFHSRDFQVGKMAFGLENVRFNITYIHNFFPLIFLLAIIGIVFIFIRREKILDFLLLIAFGLSGFFLTSFLSFHFTRFLLAEILVFSVLGGYWLEYAGKLKFPAFSFIFAYSILSMVFPFFSPHVSTEFDDINLHEVTPRPPFYMDALYPANPAPDMYKLYAVADLIKDDYDRNLRKDYSRFDFHSHSSPAVKNEGQIHLEDIYADKLRRVLGHYRLPIPLLIFGKDHPPAEYLQDNLRIPVYIIIRHNDPGYPVKAIEDIEAETGRRSRKVGTLASADRKKIDIYLIHPKGM